MGTGKGKRSAIASTCSIVVPDTWE
jgi:hypothetical protein